MQIHITFRGHSKNTLALRLIIYKGKKCVIQLTGHNHFQMFNVCYS